MSVHPATRVIQAALTPTTGGLTLDEARLAPLGELLKTDVSAVQALYEMIGSLQAINAGAAAESLYRLLLRATFGGNEGPAPSRAWGT